MTIHIKKSKNLDVNYSNASVQLLPCKIHADCDAKVKMYFNLCITKEDKILHSSFRGYPLQGTTIDIPRDYLGYVLYESVQPITKTEERNLHVTHTFNSFKYWNYDKIPTKDDVIQQAMDWIDIAEALHAPITEL